MLSGTGLTVFSLPIIAVALFMVTFDRQFGSLFFAPVGGGDPILWQHLFWLFGHPEVYILVLPSFGVISDVIPTFSKKPLFGYPVVVYAGVLIGFIGWGVWSHHMFATGLGPVANCNAHRRSRQRRTVVDSVADNNNVAIVRR